MPKNNLILNLPGFSIVKVSGYQPLLLDVKYNRLPRCSHCHSKKVRKKASYIRTVHHELIGHRRSILRFKAYKLYCHTCCRYGNQQFPGINKYQRSTCRAQAAVFHDHSQHPAIAAIYQFQQQLHTLLMKRALTQKACREVIHVFLNMLTELKQSAFKPLSALGKTLSSWKEEIARMWRFSKSNGITEGFHCKMKLIQ